MSNEIKYKLIIDVEKVNTFFNNESPFNLKKDLKSISYFDEFKVNLLEEGAYPDNPPQRCVLHKIVIDNKTIAIKKIRVDGGFGKSSGFRCVVYYDEYHDEAVLVVLMHVFSKSEKSDLSIVEKNRIKKLFDDISNNI